MMRIFKIIPDRIRISIFMFGLYLIYLFLLRICFFLIFFNEMKEVSIDLLFNSIFIGTRFDARLAVIIILPFILLSLLPLLNKYLFKFFWKAYWIITLILIFFIYAIDIGYYSYLNTRLDASIIGLIDNFYISARMVWETYPVVLFILFSIFIFYFFFIVIDKIYIISSSYKKLISIKRSILIHLIFILIFISIGYGKWSRYPFRWSDAFFSTNYSANQLAINPLLYFINTLTRVSETYDIKKVKKYYPILSDFLNVDKPDTNSLSFSRTFQPSKENNIQPNIVIIILETFPAFNCGILGNPLNPTPNFDLLAKESILFSQFYVPKISTAASIYCTLTGLPDMAIVNKSSTRDPFAINQYMLINQLNDYNKYFFIGGSANWGDLGGFLRNNIEDIVIYEEGSYDSPEINAWGISDYHLFKEANAVLSNTEEPFISLILTAGHHRPWTIPNNIPGFNKTGFTLKHKKYGFGEDNYYAYKLMDYALGEFIRDAKQENYFENTLFVIYGDHGKQGMHLNLNHGDLTPHMYHVPLIFYGPSLDIEPFVSDLVISEIDIFPTIYSLLNIPYENRSIGRNILSDIKNEGIAFLFSASSRRYGLLSDSLFIINSSQNGYNIFDSHDLSKHPKELDFIYSYDSLINLSLGIYETAKYLRYNNKKIN